MTREQTILNEHTRLLDRLCAAVDVRDRQTTDARRSEADVEVRFYRDELYALRSAHPLIVPKIHTPATAA